MESHPSEERTKILLVDDSVDNLLALEAALEVLGQELVLARSGAEALRFLLHSDFAAILLDVKMPDMDGFETAELIRSRARSRHTPILFLTAFRGEDKLRRGYNLGAVDFLFKPVIPEVLRSKVNVFVELNRSNAMLRRQAETLRDAEQQFRLLLEAAPDPMIISTESGEIQLVNERAETMFGRSRKEMIGGNISLLLPGWRPDLLQSPDRESDSSESAPPGIEIGARRKNQVSFPAEISLSPIRTKDGLVIISAVRDITERKHWEHRIRELNASLEMRVNERTAELRQTNEALRRSNEDLNHFAYAASHDLREPLRMISVYSELLQQQVAGMKPQCGDFLTVINQGARRMDALLTGLLEYARVASSDEPLERVDCESVMKEVLCNLQALIEEAKAEIVWNTMPVIRARRIHIFQLLQNLIENSVKYRRDVPPVIHVLSERDADGVVLTVSDNGIGIRQEYLSLIFGAFKRLHSHSSHPGAGIGLSLCHRIAEKYNGKIWVESVPGEGSRFFVRFPLEMMSQVAETATQAAG